MCHIQCQNNADGGTVTIHTSKKSNTCGAWYYDASNGPSSIRNTPSSFPYQTGDIQWNTFNFLYGTVIGRLNMPNSNTGVWPALWFLRADQCQISNNILVTPRQAQRRTTLTALARPTGRAHIKKSTCWNSPSVTAGHN